MQALETGRLRARLAEGSQDIARALALRQICFRGAGAGTDADAHDAACQHLLVETAAGELLCCYRLHVIAEPAGLEQSYAAQFYDLAPLAALPAPMIEMGRFCLAPGAADPDILRLAWAAMTRIVDDCGAGLLFGCSSLRGAHPAGHAAALAVLAHHVGPPQHRPGRRAPETVELPAAEGRGTPIALPSLLRSYLAMGGWVSDHAVIDRDLDTLHVFTGVEIAAIPPARARALRALAG